MNKTDQGTGQLEKRLIGLHVFPRLCYRLSSGKRIVLLALAQCVDTYSLLILLIALTCLTLFATSIRPTDVEIQGMEGMTDIHIPFEEHSGMFGGNTNDYTLTGSFSSSWFSQHVVHILPDNCVESFRINGMDVDLNRVITGNTCDSSEGFDIDLKNYLKDGTNQFEIGLRDYGRWFGLSIQHSSYDRQYFILLEILILEIAALLYFFLTKYFQLPKSIVMVMLLGFLLRILYLSYTPYSVRTYDVLEYGGHWDYIKYVATNWRLPAPDGGWEYHQAPLYYITAAITYQFSNALDLDSLSLLQILSLIYSMVFLLFGTLTLRIVCKRKFLFFTSAALLAFWPSGIIHAIRIGNDAMYYMVCVMAVYFLMRWLVDKQSPHFYLAALFAALTMATKISGLLVLGMFGIFFVSSWLKTKPKSSYLLKTIFLISIILFASYFSLFRNLTTALQDKHFNIVNGTAPYTINSGLSVENSLRNYIYFDENTYLTQAFTDTWHDVGGRQYFWNFALKSMLFGEFSFPSSMSQWIAKILSIVLLQMVIYLFIGLFMTARNLNEGRMLMILWLILSICSLVYFRHTYSFSPNADFRYIFPAIIPFLYFCLTGIDFFIESKFRMIGILGYVLVYIFIIGGCCFFVIPLAA